MPGRNIIVFLLAVAASMASFPVTATGTADGDREAVLQTVHMLLDGWREADASKLEVALHPDFREVTLHLQDGKWNFAVEERDRLIKTMGRISKGAWDDQLIDPQIHVDGPIAVVWSHYKFIVRYPRADALWRRDVPTLSRGIRLEGRQLCRYARG
jgi:hypothetical protein